MTTGYTSGFSAGRRQMPKFESQISRNDEDFRARSAHHRKLAEDLRAELQRTALGGPEKSRDKHLARGKLLPRERVRTLLDPGSPFLEIAPMAAHGLYDDQAPAAGVIAGIVRIQGVECVAALSAAPLYQQPDCPPNRWW